MKLLHGYVPNNFSLRVVVSILRQVLLTTGL